MKKIIILIILFCFSLLLSAEDLSVLQILKKADKLEAYKSIYMEMEQIITTSSGKKRTLVIRAWGKDSGDRQLSLYMAPADIKGQKILMKDDGDSIWMFNAETRRTRKLGSHMKKKKVMGSDFTYEDSVGGKMSIKYSGKHLRREKIDGVESYLVELVPTAKGPSYAKVHAWIGVEDILIRRIDFFEKGSSSAYKRMLLKDFKTIDGHTTAKRIEMKSLEGGSETINIIQSARFDQALPEKLFDPRELGK